MYMYLYIISFTLLKAVIAWTDKIPTWCGVKS